MGIILLAEEEQSKYEAWVPQRKKASKCLPREIFPAQTRVKLNARCLTPLKKELFSFEVCSRTFADSFVIPLYVG